MAWDLYIYDTLGATERAHYTDAAPGPIVGGFTWSSRPGGGNVQLRFTAVPSLMPGSVARAVVKLIINGNPVFYGTITRSWPSEEEEAREYEVRGGEELLKRRYLLAPHYEETLVEDVVASALSASIHPALSTGQIDPTGYVVNVSSPGPLDLYTLLSDLAKRVGFTWGVDPTGAVFFKRQTGETEVDYETQGLRWLPIHGEDIATKGVIYGGDHAAGGDMYVKYFLPETAYGDTIGNVQVSRAAKHLFASYEAAEHASYGLEKAAVAAPLVTDYETWLHSPKAISAASILKLLKGADQTFAGPLVCSYVGSVANTYDERDDGYPELNSAWRAIIGTPSGVYTSLYANWHIALPSYAAWGPGWASLKAYFSSNLSLDHFDITITVNYPDPNTPDLYVTQTFTVPDTSDREIIFTLENLPALADVGIEFTPKSSYTPPACGSSSDYIQVIYALGWGAVVLDAPKLAEALVRLPAQVPQEVLFENEIVDPVGTLNITQDGTITQAEVSLWEYQYTAKARASKARVGGAGESGDARAVRLLIDRTGERATIQGASV